MKMIPRVGIVSFLRSGVGEDVFEHFQHRQSKAIDRMPIDVVARQVVSSLEQISATIKTMEDSDPDLVILYFTNYVGQEIPLTLIRRTGFPILFWVVSGEDAAGLPLSGFLSTTSNLRRLGISVNYVLGAPEDGEIHKEIEEWATAASAVRRIHGARVGVIGYNPPGMIDATLDELQLLRLGIHISKYDLLELAAETDTINEGPMQDTVRAMTAEFEKSDELKQSDLERSATLYLGLRNMIESNSLDVVAVRCWPELIQKFGTTICFAFSKLADENRALGACEADSTGAVSMLIANLLSQSHVFIGDLSTTILEDEVIQLWHCGGAPCALASHSSKVRLTHHGLRPGVGVQCSFPLKTGRVTLLKLLRPVHGKDKILVAVGDAIPASLTRGEAQYGGNIVNVRVKPDLTTFIDRLVQSGTEHHLVMVYGDITSLIEKFCRLLKVEEIRVE